MSLFTLPILFPEGRIRMARPETDAQEILDIYTFYILHTTVTFECDPIPLSIFQERMKRIMTWFPWLVWETASSDGRRETPFSEKILGYAYASPFHERAAYAWDCETSMYLNQQAQRQGIGNKLYDVLLKLLQQQGYYNAYALISLPDSGSMAFHEKNGFQLEGIHRQTGFKHGQWLDLALTVKKLRTNLSSAFNNDCDAKCPGGTAATPLPVQSIWKII